MFKTRLEFGSDDSIVLHLPKITVNTCVLKFIQLESLNMYSKQVPFEGIKSPSQSLGYLILRGTRQKASVPIICEQEPGHTIHLQF